ncbi:CbtA family protein [Tuwongella immobilis]|uniref:Uncharacterized protein n=1 Tax=Tuwongella immobilis TaxID=692036 RepID=A0A6C2YT91_9BACT|nr:CbtA family protein [Tuwongella immobilis]VIP04135.1 unnamed protein product [Tuwongella immobilis]VTS05635.1 unnamed protein product [Tuwongella immobilis]
MSQLSRPSQSWTGYQISIDETESTPRTFRLIAKWRFFTGLALAGAGYYAMRISPSLDGPAAIAQTPIWYAGAVAIGLGAVAVLSFLLLNHSDTDVEEIPTLKQ